MPEYFNSANSHLIIGLNEGKAVKEIQLGPNGIMLDPEVIAQGDFDNFKICDEMKEVLKKQGINYLFPIQVATFKSAYKGKDIIARDRTGSGKTFAYSLPIIEKIRSKGYFGGNKGQAPSILVLLPTRELAI
jgi:superfamily II DNA/RNA helicase